MSKLSIKMSQSLPESTREVVVVLESAYAGSNNQLSSLARVLYPEAEVELRRIVLRNRSKLALGIARLLVRILGGSRISSLFLQGPLEMKDVVAVIAKRPTFELALVLLTQDTKTESILVGKPKYFPGSCFDLQIATVTTPNPEASIEMEFLPANQTYAEFEEERSRVDAQGWLLLLGGDCRGFSYRDSDWRNLLEGVARRALAENQALTVATSPRTPASVKIMLEELQQEMAELEVKSCFFGQEKVPPLLTLLASANMVWVTEDSGAMLSDAVNCRLPVISIRPQEDSQHKLSTPQAEVFAERGRILRGSIAQLPNLDCERFVEMRYRPVEECWSSSLLRQRG